VIDGTFVDMLKAVSTGDWMALGLCAMAFVPGGNPLKGLKALGKSERLIGKIGKFDDLKMLTKGNKNLEVHHLAEKRFASAIGVKEKDIPCMIVKKETHYEKYTSVFREKIAYGSDYEGLGAKYIGKTHKEIYGEGSPEWEAVKGLFGM